MISQRARQLLLVVSTALVVVVLAPGAVASAQTLPGGPVAAYASSPAAQLMLAGEAGAVADFLGISTDQLHTELVGHSLAQVAQQHGKRVEDVTGVVVDTASRQLDVAVSLGQLSSDEASRYRFQIALFAPLLVNSQEASAMALSAVAA
jgi:hypothetical protein